VIETIHVRKTGNLYFAWPKVPPGNPTTLAFASERLDAVGKLIDRMLARGFVLADSVGITTDEPLPASRRRARRMKRSREALNPIIAIRADRIPFNRRRTRGGEDRAARCAVSSWSF
jgi:hypothetical protein